MELLSTLTNLHDLVAEEDFESTRIKEIILFMTPHPNQEPNQNIYTTGFGTADTHTDTDTHVDCVAKKISLSPSQKIY